MNEHNDIKLCATIRCGHNRPPAPCKIESELRAALDEKDKKIEEWKSAYANLYDEASRAMANERKKRMEEYDTYSTTLAARDKEIAQLRALHDQMVTQMVEADMLGMRYKEEAERLKAEFTSYSIMGDVSEAIAFHMIHSWMRAIQTAWQKQNEAIKVRDTIIKELVESSREVLSSAVILSKEYLSVFDTWPDTATIQGWDKKRWVCALKAKDRMNNALAKATEQFGWRSHEQLFRR